MRPHSTTRRLTQTGITIALALAAGGLAIDASRSQIAVVGGVPANEAPRAQTASAAGGPTFEVASVKQNKSGGGLIGLGMQPGGRYTATNVPLRLLIQNAYQIQPNQLVGAPGWLDTDRFDIVAKADPALLTPPPGGPGSGPAAVQLMVRALLADRFKLTVHNETRDLPIYALVLARSDGSLGPQMKPISAECATMLATRRGGPGPGGRGGPGPGGPPPPPAPPQPGEKIPCGQTMLGPGTLRSGGAGMAQITQMLSQAGGPMAQSTGRLVQDKTGLTGQYEFELQWTPEPGQGPLGRGGDLPPGFPVPDPNGPSLFTAIQEQLGLKLDARRAPVDVIVIDKVEHPTDD